MSDKVRERERYLKKSEIGRSWRSKTRLATADNNRFLRLWNEVNYNKIGYNMSNSQKGKHSGVKNGFHVTKVEVLENGMEIKK